MQCEPPDMRFYSELKDLNRAFLSLIVDSGRSWQRPVFGLDAGCATALGHLSDPELDYIATAPGMLASLDVASAPQSVSESMQNLHRTDSGWIESTRLFCAATMTYLWQLARRDQLVTAMCVGPGGSYVGWLAALSFCDIQRSADRAIGRLNARFARHPTFWPDLIRAARSADHEFRAFARLSIIPLTLAEQRARDAIELG